MLTWIVDGETRQYDLSDSATVGRSYGSDIVLRESSISKSHARITHENGEWVFEDLASRNGSRINDERLTRAVLCEGDRIQLGGVTLTFVAAEPEPPGPLTTAEAPPRMGPAGQPLGTAGIPGEPDPDFLTLASVNAVALPLPSSHDDGGSRALSRHLEASYEISRATAATLDLSGILDRVLSALLGIFDTAECAAVMLLDRRTGEIVSQTVKRRQGAEHEELIVSQTALEHVLAKRESLVCLDTRSDNRFAGAVSIAALGIRSMMIAPILFRDLLYGAIYIDRRSTAAAFTQEDLELLTVAAVDVGGCVANAELHKTVVERERLAAIGETVASLSHCIRNCLQGIQGGAYVLEMGLEKGDLDGVGTGWGMVRHKRDFLEELVRDLLNFSKEREPEYATANLNELCADLCDIGSENAPGPAVSVTFVPDPKLEAVEIDPKGIRRCLMNLVKNSMDACAESGGKVAVETVRPGDDGMVVIRVRDDGCGMSEETLGRLFTPFFSTKGSKGTGLGLPMLKKTVTEHGGRIDVASREGEGTTFEVFLPRSRPLDPGRGRRSL